MKGRTKRMKKKGFGVSPITNQIYYGTQDTERNIWVGQKQDVTNDCLAAAFTWFMYQFENDEKINEYSRTYLGSDFELVMRRKEKNDKNKSNTN